MSAAERRHWRSQFIHDVILLIYVVIIVAFLQAALQGEYTIRLVWCTFALFIAAALPMPPLHGGGGAAAVAAAAA